jgi:hypothetical protein
MRLPCGDQDGWPSSTELSVSRRSPPPSILMENSSWFPQGLRAHEHPPPAARRPGRKEVIVARIRDLDDSPIPPVHQVEPPPPPPVRGPLGGDLAGVGGPGQPDQPPPGRCDRVEVIEPSLGKRTNTIRPPPWWRPAAWAGAPIFGATPTSRRPALERSAPGAPGDHPDTPASSSALPALPSWDLPCRSRSCTTRTYRMQRRSVVVILDDTPRFSRPATKSPQLPNHDAVGFKKESRSRQAERVGLLRKRAAAAAPPGSG